MVEPIYNNPYKKEQDKSLDIALTTLIDLKELKQVGNSQVTPRLCLPLCTNYHFVRL